MRALPWYSSFDSDQIAEMSKSAILAIWCCMTLIVIPGLYTWHLIARRRWSMRTLLALPIVVAVVMCGLTLGPATNMSDTFATRLQTGALTLPAILFPALILFWMVTGRFRRALGWTAGSIALAVFGAFWTLWLVEPQYQSPMLPGETYSSEGWFWIWFIAAYATGAIMMFALPGARMMQYIYNRFWLSAHITNPTAH